VKAFGDPIPFRITRRYWLRTSATDGWRSARLHRDTDHAPSLVTYICNSGTATARRHLDDDHGPSLVTYIRNFDLQRFAEGFETLARDHGSSLVTYIRNSTAEAMKDAVYQLIMGRR
jgi:hypothetical protein